MTQETVFSVMAADIEYIDEGQPLERAAQMMREQDTDLLAVQGGGGRLVGVITDRDLVLRGSGAGKDPTTCPVSEILDGTLVTVRGDDSTATALARMAEHRIRSLPVVGDDRLIGVVRLEDLARCMPSEAIGMAEAAIAGPE